MTGNSYLLDTSVIIHTFRANNTVSQKLDALEAVFVPVIVIGELHFGAYKSSDSNRNLQQIELFFKIVR
jgi:tRNA(fMet)-specific endonuclease VapC